MSNIHALAKQFGLSLAQTQPILVALLSVRSVKARADKDARRIQMFQLAVAQKGTELAVELALAAQSGDLEGAESAARALAQFGIETCDEAAKWVETAKGAVKKFSLANIFGKRFDPFEAQRQSVRTFAKKWDIDAAFVEAMG